MSQSTTIIGPAAGCTCLLIDPGDYVSPDAHPAELEQDPLCPVHTDIVAARAERDHILAAVRAFAEFAAHAPGCYDSGCTCGLRDLLDRTIIMRNQP